MGLRKSFKSVMKGFIRWAVEDDGKVNRNYAESSLKAASLVSSGSIGDRNRGMNFTVFQATGGKVIQFSSYDQHTDRTNSNLYIIADKEDLGEELGQIITKESLTR